MSISAKLFAGSTPSCTVCFNSCMRLLKLPSILKSPFHFVWVILFFVVNGYNSQSQAIPFSHLLLLFFLLTGISALFFWIAFRIFKSSAKAGVFTTFSLTAILFFGAYQDWIGSLRHLAFLGSLTMSTLILLGTIIILLIWLKTTKRQLNKTTIFANTLFLVYLLLETIILLQEVTPYKKKSQPGVISSCDGCSKPDVYLILLDEYFGSKGLHDYYGFDNSAFEKFLEQKGFNVLSNTRSNYDLTLFSMASMLNMDYLKDVGDVKMENAYAYKNAFLKIEFNVVVSRFKQLGYRIDNQSIFRISDAPSAYASGLLPSKIQLINSKTFYYRLAKNLPVFLAKKGRIPFFAKKIDEHTISTNQKIIDNSLKNAAKEDTVPVFSYIHLQMPHTPFAFDSTGKQMIPFWQRKSYTSAEWDSAYLQYLVYTNKKISDYLQKLMQLTNGRSVVLLMSDHGYRDADPRRYKDTFQSLNAVYVPGKSTAGWYDGMTNVNQFRILFNTLFNDRLPLLKDSIIP